MATTQYCISRLTKLGVGAPSHRGNQYWLDVNGYEISFHDQAGDAICFRVRRIGDEDDSMTDYFAGVWPGNITRCIKLVQAKEA